MSAYDSITRLDDFMSKVKRDVNLSAATSLDDNDAATPVLAHSTAAEDSSASAASASPDGASVVDAAMFAAVAKLSPSTVDQASDAAISMKHSRPARQDLSHLSQNIDESPSEQYSGSGNMLDDDLVRNSMTPTQIELLAIKNHQPNVENLVGVSELSGSIENDGVQPEVITGATVDGANRSPRAEGTTAPQEPIVPHMDQTNPSIQDESCVVKAVVDNSEVMESSQTGTPVSSPQTADFKPSISIASPTISPTPITVQREPSSEPLSADTGAVRQASDILASKIADVKINIKEELGDVHNHKVAGEGASREHATFFSAWGTPEARSRPKSRARKVILSGLPGNADYTFVQALVHGGTLESITMSSTGNTAYVLFTTGEACDNFCDKYPNGISIKHRGRSLTMFVDKGKEVDVVSSMLEAYLSAGASRVVRASNADEDWSMRALNRIAEGDNKRRKVETISDEFRNETRTVTFRFANIADAVMFRNTLKRDPEWEASEIQFVADPCEKATGFHFE